MSATTVEGLLAALESHGAAAPGTAPEPTAQPAAQPATPGTATPTQAPPETPPATPPATPEPPATPPTEDPQAALRAEIAAQVRKDLESEWARKEAGLRGNITKADNAAKRAQEALSAREKQIDDDLARMRDAQPNQQGRDYYQAAIDKRSLDRERQALDADKQEIAGVKQSIQSFQQQAQEQVLRSEAEGILPGYLKEQLATRGLPEEAAAEITAIIDLPANQRFLKNASLDAAFTWIAEMGQYIDAQLPTLQTRWAQGNRQAAQAGGDHWRPTGGPGGAPATVERPKTMGDTSYDGLASFLTSYEDPS